MGKVLYPILSHKDSSSIEYFPRGRADQVLRSLDFKSFEGESLFKKYNTELRKDLKRKALAGAETWEIICIFTCVFWNVLNNSLRFSSSTMKPCGHYGVDSRQRDEFH